jgi:acetyltransferase-like isoleucine patch superfamily enzyme
MSFKINDTLLEQINERVKYEILPLIPSLTGATGPIANYGVLSSTGTLINNIIPKIDNTYSLGSFSNQFNNIFTNTVYINNIPLSVVNNSIELPSGTMIEGVTIGTILILGTKDNSSLLPVSANIGDAYIIGNNFNF